jgi:pimeloyl-ACP methyl ester carboxylesterase
VTSAGWIEAENERYRAALFFLSGLWTSAEIWRPVALAFAHRGWRCLLVDGSAVDRPPTFAVWREAVAEAAKRCDELPILIGHDAGGLVALGLAADGRCRGAIAVSPLLDGVGRLLSLRARWQGWLGIGAIDPPPAGHPWHDTLSSQARDRLAASLRREPAVLVGTLRGDALLPGRPRAPTLLVAQEKDAVVSPALIEVTARGLEVECLRLPGGRWPMLEANMDAWMSPLHRWIIRTQPELLLLRGDEDLRED